jgi:molecular chaperone DnaJ
MKDYYKILEIEENSTQDEIKKKYRSLSKQYHPDVNPDGAEKFKEIAEAYEVLGDKNKRDQYDKSKNNPFSGTEFENFFSQMFGNSNGGRVRRKTVQDKVINVNITPIESYMGSNKVVNYIKNVDCVACDGSGGDRQECSDCGGNGFTIKTYGTGFLIQQIRNVCGSCGGRGYTLIHKCSECMGSGSKLQNSTINFNIPTGVDTGQYLKFVNYGDISQGETGDLIIRFEVIPQDGFEKVNNDLIYNLFLNLDDLKEDKHTIPHPDGGLKITLPKTFDTSIPLRLRGKGFNSGDMYIKLHVKFERPD